MKTVVIFLFVLSSLFLSSRSTGLRFFKHGLSSKKEIEETSLKTQDDARWFRYWRFPKDRPYHYVNYTEDIQKSFLPVDVASLPKAEGVWILRHKDFSGPSRTFDEDEDGPDVSTIKFRTISRLFYSVRIRAIIFGDVTFDLTANPQLYERSGEPQTVALAGYQECVRKSTQSEHAFKWISYEIKTNGLTHVELHTTILHQKSFLLLDEITISYEDPDLDESIQVKCDVVD